MPKLQRKILSGSITAALLSLSAASLPVSAGLTQQVEDALNFYHYGHNGAIKFDLNYRYENVNEDNRFGPTGTVLPAAKQPETANANTARLRLGFLTPTWQGLQAYAEYEGNLAMQDDYYDTLPNVNPPLFSRVADPDRSELNQFWLAYTGIPDHIIKVGRQRIKLDDDRFIGNVGWRQMETTYDSVLITHNNQTLFGLVANVGYIANVQTFVGTTENIQAPILNLNYKMGDIGNLIAYGYWLDYTEKENYEKSSQTYGLRASCCTKPLDSYTITDDLGVVYTAEWSHQSDYESGPTPYDAERYNVMAGVSAYNVMFQGAMEQLDGSGLNKHFDTPLGTNHAFQGWADLFLVTPNNGIRDVFGTVMVPFQRGDLVFSGIYHEYSDDTGRFDYGDEWNFQAVKKFGKHYSLLAKYAYYQVGDDADPSFKSTDTQKIWLQGNISF
ncbi:MAG: alginate export family protein [Methylovulum sp.]|uniref:alginate export family protein n=1 Tax=Methylovulum sp. TaxID=1916980 RepID=UPI00263778F3|nr:alginate export family protein [Methylovulum sp.]MDD2725422.1 alginate export family protein [Methylovulum sp.]MDD5125281.1 alginate export family protein [Methylovulum sp.]